MSSFDRIFAALEEANARYVVVGGLAVVLHGYARLTADIDLVVDFSEGEPVKVVAALERIGMVPRAPVQSRAFADAAERRKWVTEKQLKVFSMHDRTNPLVEVDLFVDPPIGFDELLSRASTVTLRGRNVCIACIEDLIAMKRMAGRPKDLDDIAALEAIKSRGESR